jgi:cob(I)alamin adenosyltransferase
VKVYTKTGDDGTTGRFLGGRVSKADLLVEASGDVDEAIAALAVVRAGCTDDALAEIVFARQRELFVVGADLAANPDHRERLVAEVSAVTEEMIGRLEELIDRLVAERPLRPVFIVPGADPTSAGLDLARTVVRRAERHAVGALQSGEQVSGMALRYLNRLSDLLFVLARHCSDGEEPASHD